MAVRKTDNDSIVIDYVPCITSCHSSSAKISGCSVITFDKRQSRNIDELIKAQHELTIENHKMINSN